MAQPVMIRSSQSSLSAYSSLGASYQAEITRLQGALHDLAISISMAKRTGQTQAATMLQAQFNDIKRQVDNLIARQRAEESPSRTAMSFANFSDAVTNLPGKLGKLLVPIALGVGALTILPLLLRRRR